MKINTYCTCNNQKKGLSSKNYVNSINTFIGDVTLTSDDIREGKEHLYFSEAKVKALIEEALIEFKKELNK